MTLKRRGFPAMFDDAGLLWDEWDIPVIRRWFLSAFQLALDTHLGMSHEAQLLIAGYGLDGGEPLGDEALAQTFRWADLGGFVRPMFQNPLLRDYLARALRFQRCAIATLRELADGPRCEAHLVRIVEEAGLPDAEEAEAGTLVWTLAGRGDVTAEGNDRFRITEAGRAYLASAEGVEHLAVEPIGVYFGLT